MGAARVSTFSRASYYAAGKLSLTDHEQHTFLERAMKRRLILLVVALGVMIVIAAAASRKQTGLLVLEWAAKAPDETFAVVVLIVRRTHDAKATDRSGRATVTGPRPVQREWYR